MSDTGIVGLTFEFANDIVKLPGTYTKIVHLIRVESQRE